MTSMLLLLDLALVALIVVIGFIGGWCAHWYEARRRLERSQRDHRLAREVLGNLQRLIDNVSSDMGEHGDYLLRTWFPPTAKGLTAASLSRREREWTGLEVLAREQRGDQGFVEFKARCRDSDNQQHVVHEKSIFQRSAGRWLYVGGDVTTSTPSQ